MRQFAGFGTAQDTNGRFKELLRSGGDGLIHRLRHAHTCSAGTPTTRLSKGEVGRAGVAVDTLDDMGTLLSRASTSGP